MATSMEPLTAKEILTILRAADQIIAMGGRTQLVKILKGSKEKRVLELGLDTNPAYGSFSTETMAEILKKVDWMIDYDFLELHFQGKLPTIVFTDRGWALESDQRADEFLQEWVEWLSDNQSELDMGYLKDRNRDMILLFLDKVRETGNPRFIPFLEAWKDIEYKKVRAAIQTVIEALKNNEPVDKVAIDERKSILQQYLKGSPPQDLRLKCWECSERFTFTVGEQRFYKEKGFSIPKRCDKCRERRKFGHMIDEF